MNISMYTMHMESEEEAEAFLEEFNLLDPRKFPAEQINL